MEFKENLFQQVEESDHTALSGTSLLILLLQFSSLQNRTKNTVQARTFTAVLLFDSLFNIADKKGVVILDIL